MGELLKTHVISQHLLLLLFSISLLQLSPASSETYLIDCGSATETASIDNRTFQADSNSSLFTFTSTSCFSGKDQNPPQNSSALYHTARIFSGQSSYQFHIKENGTYFMRLHFSTFQSRDYNRFAPFSADNYNLAAADFEVSAYGISILNFSSDSDTEKVVKEFILTINSDTFTLSFLPAPAPNSFGFVSAIEVLPAPSNLMPNSVEKFDKLADYILKTVYRVNVGGPEIAPSGDSLFRHWTSDDGLLLHNNSAIAVNISGSLNYLPGLSNPATAPADVYRSGRSPRNLGTVSQNFNITWMFEGISLDHHYFIRLHFCDIISKTSSDLNFNIYISSIAKENFQPGSMTNQRPQTPLYKDFVADPNSAETMPISIMPSEMASTGKRNAILNGVEIMKMISIKNTKQHKKPLILIASITGGCVFLGLAVLTVFILLKKRHKPLQKKGVAEEVTSAYSYGTNLTYGSRSPNNFCLQICFADLKSATDNFDERCVIGHGGFGKVYRGMLKDGTVVAVKRANPDSKQGLQEFQAEIMVLSRIRHIHLVSLIGYCEEESEMILVYEFMEKGTLQKHLYGLDLPCLTWKQRLEICIGAARGLHYLHTGSSYQAIIHRDVKTSNILLDEDYTAKVADFGLSKLGPTFSQTHVSTNVKGSFGYMDPEYFKRHQLTEKSDVYSFGVVLLEVLSAKPAIDITRSSGKQSLVEWGMQLHRRGMMEKIVDQRIKDQIHPSALRNIEETVVKCLADYGVDRPSMGEVLWSLEYALRLQQTALGSREPHEDSNTAIDDFGQGVRRVPSSSVRMSSPLVVLGEGESDDESHETGLSSGRIFSQLVKSEGR